MLLLQLEKGEKLPDIVFSQQMSIKEVCPKCGEDFTLFFHKSPFDGRKWFAGECDSCEERIYLSPKQCDLLQPSSKLFKIYYGKDIFKEAVENQKKNNLMQEKLRMEREDRLLIRKRQGILKASELEDIKKYTRTHNLE